MATLEELQLHGFSTVGNIYVDNSYSADATPATDPITGEALTFGENAFGALTGGTVSVAPAVGSALFLTNVNNGGDRIFNGRSDGTLYDFYASGVTSGDIYVMPRAAGDYSPDGGGTLNVFIEGASIASGGYHGFGATEKANFVGGDYEVTIKNSTMQYLAVATGSAWGVDNGTFANHRFATVDGDITFAFDNLTVTSVAGVARGQVGTADNQAKITGTIANSKFGNNFHIIQQGTDGGGQSFNSWTDIDITITGSSFSGAFMMLPNQSSATREVNGELTLHGDIKLKMTGSTVNGLVIGAGRSGTGWQRTGWVDGDIDFELSGSTTGTTFINKGSLGTSATQRTVTGKIDNGSVIGNIVAYELRSDKSSKVYADSAITVTDATIGKFTFLVGLNGSGGTTVGVADRLYGTQTLEFTGSTAGDILSVVSGTSQSDATFALAFHASDKQSVVGTINAWDTMTVDAGASVRATAVDTVGTLTLKGGNLLTAGTISGVTTLAVVDDTLSGDVVLVSGLTSYDNGVETVTVNGTEYTYGVFGGQYSYLGGSLIAHVGETYLVNNNYAGNGINTDLNLKGYKDLGAAQDAAKASGASLAFTTLDDVDDPDFTADVSTLDVATLFLGEEGGDTLDLDGVSIVIGDSAADVASAEATIAYANNINSISFGNVTGTAKATITDTGANTAINTLDLTGAVLADADISVSNSVIGDVKLDDQAASAGKITISNSTITNVIGAAGGLEADLTGANTITNVYADGNGAKIKLGTSTVEKYLAGSSESGKVIETLVYNDGVSAQQLIIGGNANNIGKIDATVTGGIVQELIVGNDGDTVAGDIDLNLAGGTFDAIKIAENATVGGAINVELTGGTVDTVNSTFYGLVYGASVSGALDGGSQGTDRKLTVNGYARVGSITNFSSIEVKGGTLNVESGDRKSDPTAENKIEINGDITNRRAIQAGAISAKDLNNYGMVGVLRNEATDPGIQLSGNFLSTNFVRTSVLTVDGNFSNSGEITSVGDITVNGTFSNSGQIYIRSSFDKETSVFTQDGGIKLNGVDMVNSGADAFISTGFLSGVKNLTTNRLYVTGGAEISGNITIEAGAEVAFTNKAVKEGSERYDDFKDNGLKLTGSISMYDTSSLIVSGTLSSGNKTITVNTEGDGLIGSNVLVHAEAGVDSWTINWGTGLTPTSYGVLKSSSEITLYSVGELFVNSEFAGYEEGDSVIINGKTFLFGYNAFATVEDATYFATSKGFTTSRIAILNDATGMNVDAEGFDVELINSTVGTVTAKGIFVESDSKIGAIAAATGLTIDASAALSITDTIPEGLAVVIDAADGSGSRKVLSTDPAKVLFADGQVTVQAPLGNDTYAADVAANGEVFLKADANIFLFASDATIVDGTVDKATGDVLFAGVNAFTDEAAAAAAASAAGATLYLVDGSNKIRAIEGVSKVAIEYTGGSSVYGSEGDAFISDQPYSVQISGVTSTAKVYGINKSVDMSGDYTFVMTDSVLSDAQSALYITGNDVNNKFNGNITAELTNVRVQGRQDKPWNNPGRSWNEGIYIGYGSFGTDPNSPINIDVTLRGVTSGNSGFYGIQTQPSDGPHDIDTSTSATPKDQQVRQDINANINIKVYDSVFGGTFTVLNTNNEHWDANGASLLNTYFSSGSITVEVGNSDFGGNNIRLGASLQLGGKAIQEFNVPNTLHIVATENGTTTRASYINEWDTIIVDATAQLILSDDVQYSTVFDSSAPLDDAGTLSQIMINMSGYKSGTHNVITARSIATDTTLSNITVIGDNDLTGQCQLAYALSGNTLTGIYIFDKADDMYVNAAYDDTVNGTKVAGQELLLNYNAFTEFNQALTYADEWGGTIIVTGGVFGTQDFHGNNVEVRAATIGNLTMAAEAQAHDTVTLTVKDGAVIGSVDGSNDLTASSVLEIAGAAQIGDIFDFDTVTMKKGVALEVGEVAGAGFNMFADNELKAKSVSFNANNKIVLDVTGYTGKGHAIISTENGITNFDPSMVTLEAHDKGKVKTNLDNYSVLVVGNDLVLRNALKSDTYLNSEYTAASLAGGITLADGSYLEYGFNAFDDPTDAAANLGSGSKFTLTVTGGEISGDIKLGGNNFVLDEGIVDGVVYACVNTADKGGFYSGKTYTVTAGTIGGFDLTAGEGVYTATNSAINFGETATVTGNIIGGGDTIVTTEGNLTVNGLIMGVTELVLNSDGFISAGGINLGSGEGESTVAGTVRVNVVPGAVTEGNRRLLVQSETDILNVKFAEVTGGTVYSTGKEIYFLDLSRVYFDPNFTVDIDGKKIGEDTLLWNVNAFSNFNDAVSAARKNGATLYIQNGGGNVNITGTPLVDLVISDSTIPTIEAGLSGNQNAGSDNEFHVVIKNSTIANNNSYIMGQGAWNSRNTFSGTFTLDVSDSVVNGGRLRLGSFFNSGNKTYVLNFTDTEIRGDMGILDDSPFGASDSVTVNMTGVTAPVTKWWTFFDGYPNEDAGSITVNLKDSVLGDTGNGFRFALQRSNGTSNQFNGTKVTFNVDNTTVNGSLQIEKMEGQDITFNGTAVLNVTGDNYVRYALKFNEVNIAAGATITGSTMTTRNGVVNVDVTGYEGPTKDIVWMSSTLQANLGDVKGLKDGYLVIKGDKAIVISNGVIGNLYVDQNYTSAITGSTSSAGDILIFEADAGAAGDEAHANALTYLEDGKKKLTAGNKLFVASSENVLYGTMENEEVTPFVNLVVTNGDFSTEGSKIAAANLDDGKSVSGTSVIELAGGSIGKAAVTHTDEETGEVIIDEPAVYATISGAKNSSGGKSDFVLSKTGGIYADVTDFATMTVTAESRVHGTITVDALTIDNTGFLTVDGTLVTDSIHISTAGYEGASKKVLVADALATFDESKITADEGGELFLDREDKTLWLVSTAPGNVYFNTGYTEAVNGTSFNNDLLFLDSNAFTAISRETIAMRSTSANTVYVLDGNFGAEVTDLSGIGTRKIQLDGGNVGGFKVDAGSAVTISGATSAVTLGSIEGVPVGEGEAVTEGYSLTLNSAKAATLNSAEGVSSVTINAANAANLTVGKIDYREAGGALTVDFAGYTIGDAASATLLTVAGGINNFLQYTQPEEGEAYTRTVVSTRNNGENLMVYYDETGKALKAVKRGNAAFYDPTATDAINGTVQVVDGVANTKVYGFNVSDTSIQNLVNGLSNGDTLVVNNAQRDINPTNNKDINGIIEGSSVGTLQLGYTSSSHTRTGSQTVLIKDSTINGETYLAGQGNDNDNRITLVVGEEVEGEMVGGYDYTFQGGLHNDNTNKIRVTRNANISGNTVSITFDSYSFGGDMELFNDVHNGDGELKAVNVTFKNTVVPSSKWMWIWDPRDANATTINLTITDTYFGNSQDPNSHDTALGILGNDVTDWGGVANVTISGATSTGRLSAARGIGANSGSDALDTGFTDDSKRYLSVQNNGANATSDIYLVNMFSQIEIAEDAFLTGGTISMSEKNDGFVLLGTVGADYGNFKEFVSVSGSINNATTAKFVDATDKETEIAGYVAVVGATNVFVYKDGSLGDVFYSTQYDAKVNGTAVKNLDGSDTVLVFGDNAVKTVADAYAALAASEGAAFHIEHANNTDLYTNGYVTAVNGGSITNLFGGNAPDLTDPENPVAAEKVAKVDITVNKTATITNLTVANELSAVTDNALITVNDGVAISGTIDGGSPYVGGTSELVFKGSASAGSIVGFDTVTVNANDVVSLTGAFTGTAITIDATDFADFSKKVLTATAFNDVAIVTIANDPENKFGYQIVNDGEGKALIITSDLVKDTYANAAWTPETQLGFVGDTALVWDGNAFNSAAAAAAKVGEGNILYIEGGVFDSTEAVTLEKNNDVVVKDDASLGAITTGGKLSVSKALVASSISGVSALNLAAGNNFAVSDGIALAADATISIDVTGYEMTGDDAVVLSTGTGITVGEAAIADASITVTGTGAGAYHAYYDAEGMSIHLLRLNTLYVSSAWEGGNNMPEYFDATGEKLIYGVNAFDRMNTAGPKLVDGQKLWAYRRNGSVHTGGPSDVLPAGEQGKLLSEVHIVDSNVDRIVVGGTNGDQVYNGDTKIFVENSTLLNDAVGNPTGANDWSVLVSRVVSSDANENAPYNHRNTLVGNVDVMVTNSTIGTTTSTGLLYILDDTFVRDVAATETEPAKKSAINVTFKDTKVFNNINFLGDSPMGGQEAGILNINVENVEVTGSTWGIREGGTGTRVIDDTTAADPVNASTVTVNVKDSTFDANSRFGIDFNYSSGWANPWTDPSCSSDFIFNLDNSTFKGYLVAGRVDAGDNENDTTPELPSFIGNRVLNVIGSNYVKNALWFKEVNLTGDSSLQGDTLRLYNADSKINIDITGYEGPSRYLVALNFTYDGDGNVTAGGIENFDAAKTFVITGLAEGETIESKLRTDYDAETGTISTVVLMGKITDIYVNSTYVEDDFDEVLGRAYTTGEAMFYGSNAFSVMVGYEDEESGLVVPGALDALTDPTTILHVTGGAVETETLLNNAITIDANATLAYQGNQAIDVNGTIQNNGNFVIDASGFVAGSPDRVTILIADELLGNDIKVTTKAYAVEKTLNEVTGKTELALVLKASDVFVNTAWVGEGYEPGAEVVIDDTTAYMGYTAFASADAALSKVNNEGTITVIASNVEFSNPIARGVTVVADGTSTVKATVGAETAGALVLQAGAIGYGLNINGTSSLTVEAGAIVTGGLGLTSANVTFAAGSTLDFYIVGQNAIEGARVTNLVNIGTSTPDFTVTVDGNIKDGTYKLATGAAGFGSAITLKTEAKDIQVLAFGERFLVEEFGAYFQTGVTEDGILTLTKEASQDVIYVDSTWEAGKTYTVGDVTVTIGENGFLTGDEAAAKAISSGATSINVHGGEVSFTDGVVTTTLVQSGATLVDTNVTGTLTVSAGATVAGKAVFAPAEGKTITIDGTVAFDTANATADVAQFSGLSSIVGNTKYTLTVTGTVASGDSFLLATGAEGFASKVALTGTDVELTVGELQKVGDLGYTLVLDAGNLTLNISDKPVPALVYVNSTWTVGDGEPVQISDTVTATMGYDAFKSGNSAYAGVTADGVISVLGGEVSFSSAIAKTLTVDASATLTGKAEFATGTAITIDGTIRFDTQYAATAQITGLANVIGATKYELVDGIATAGTYILASGLTEFTSEVAFGTDKLTVGGESVKVDDLTYTLSLSEANDLTLTVVKDEPPTPVVTLAYVNSEWTGLADGTEVTVGDKTAKIGTDAFATLALAEVVESVTSIEVVGGEISFADGYNKTITVDATATVTGKAAFTAPITINGTIAFNTTDATATAAQFSGLSNVNGSTKYMLTPAAAAGTYLLASDAAGFNSTVTLESTALAVGETKLVGTFNYALSITETNDLALTVSEYVPPTPTYDLVYVNSEWTGLADGTEVTIGEKTATIGADAFATGDIAILNVTDDGTVEVVGGEVSFTNTIGKAVTVDAGATLTGKATFGVAITVNGTIAFDTQYATATAAQFNGFSFVSGSASYTLTAAAVAGTYLLASDAATFSSDVALTGTTVSLTVGGEAVEIGDLKYALGITENNDLALTITEVGPGPQPTVPTKAFVNSEWAGLADGTVIAGHTIGFDGFDTLAKADAAETTEQAIEVVGGELKNFADAYTKTITVDAGTTITGASEFTKAITVDGTFILSTEIATATAAQVKGYANVIGGAQFILVDPKATVGTYLLVDGITTGLGFTVQFGYDTLEVGHSVTVGDLVYTLSNENSVLSLDVAEYVPPTPTTDTFYVNSAWAGLADGTVVDVKEGVKATIGTDAFATGDKAAAVAALVEDGEIEVVGGEVSFTDPITEPITIDEGATLSGKATFVSGATVNGTIAFDTDYAQDGAQFTGFENVELGDDAQITLTVGELAAGAKVTLTDAPTDKTDKNANPLYGRKVSVFDENDYEIGSAYFAAADGVSYVLDLDKNGQLVLSEVAQRRENNDNDNLIVSKQPDAKVIGEDVPYTILTLENPEVFVDPVGEVKQEFEAGKTYYNFVNGTTDKIDYAQIVVEHGAKLVFDIEATDKAKITLYSVSVNSKGQWSKKSLKSASLTRANGTKSTAAVYVTGGTYYVAVSNSNKKTSGAFYNVTLNAASSYIYADADNNWNDYVVKSKALNPSIADLNVTEITENGTQSVQFDDAPLTLDPTDSYENFVGYTDTVDFAKISSVQPVALTFTLKTTGKATLNVYSLTKNSKGVWTQSKSLKSIKITAKAGDTKSSTVLYLDRLVATTGAEATGYYVSVTSSDKKGNVNYNVSVASQVYEDADFGTNGVLLNASKVPNDKLASTTINATKTDVTTEVINGEDNIVVSKDFNDKTYTSFVGLGDQYDYAEVVLNGTGKLTLSVETYGTTKSTAKFTLYKLTQKSNGTWSKSSVGTLSVKTDGTYGLGEGSKTFTIKAATSATVKYYVGVESVDAKKGKEMYYNAFASFDGASSAALDMPQDDLLAQTFDSFANTASFVDSSLVDDKQFALQSVPGLIA